LFFQVQNLEMKVVVASKNPVKLQAVQEGFQSFFDLVEVSGVEVEIRGFRSAPFRCRNVAGGRATVPETR
jgi:non-canonical (house-cleaning) NTP pyrophosphatase